MESTYVSAFQIYNNIYDFKINFSAIEPQIDEAGNIVGQTRVPKERITLSPALAKELAQMLTSMVDDYEKKFGQTPELIIDDD